jgi:acetoin utilization deacetylase AcuC-like enzyme/formylglycine-generating enzyme required for sulfatase activity
LGAGASIRRALWAAALVASVACEKVEPPESAPAVVTSAGGVEMVLIPAGEFVMGRDGGGDESPAHRVRLDAFLMDRTEVTQAQYEKLKLSNPSRTKGPDLPVHMMSWRLAAFYCNERSRAEGLTPCYNEETAECDFEADGYRLPTEAEWEYACRAGGASDYSCGDDPRALGDAAWYAPNAEDKPHPVARKRPNAWGLYDMHGNVAEWCNDIYAKDAYAQSAAENPRGPAEGKQYVVRGGCFKSDADQVRSRRRSMDNPGFSDACLAPETLGFRCVRRAPRGQARAPTGFLYDEIYLKHDTGAGFPERPARIEAIAARLKEKGLTEKLTAFKAVPAPLEWIHLLHDPAYVERLRRACAELGGEVKHFEGVGDCPIGARSYDAAVAAVGGLLSVLDAVMEGKIRNAFCAVRPPGHHALRDRAMGFCFFNNVAIGARYLQSKHKLGRVLIIDWDVHHGNGTQDAFYEDGTVMYFSTHQHPFYPGTGKAGEKGRGKGEGLILNVPLAAGEGDAAVLKAYEEKLVPAARSFKPDFVLVSCGFDSHAGDQLGSLAITDEGYARMTRIVKKIAEEHARGRLVSVLEGGYTLENLAGASEAHVRVLME